MTGSFVMRRGAFPLLVVGLILVSSLLSSSGSIGAQINDRVARRSAAHWALQSTASLLQVAASSPPTAQAVCAAVFIAPDAVLTAQHCIEGRLPALVVRPFQGTDVPVAAVARESRERDLALLRLQKPAEHARPAPLSVDVAVGDEVFVVGSPMGEPFVLTRGVVSKIFPHRTFGGTPEDPWGSKPQQILMTDALTVIGNSGGPLFDDGGNLVGIVVRVWPGPTILHGFAVGGQSIKAFFEGR